MELYIPLFKPTLRKE